MASRVAGMSPADASMRLVEWLMYYQSKAEERLGQDLNIPNVKEALMGGFIANRELAPRDRERVEILIKIMSLGQQALEVPIGKGSNSAQVLEKLVDEAEALYNDFQKL
jgi:hypothetical protein